MHSTETHLHYFSKYAIEKKVLELLKVFRKGFKFILPH